MRLLIAVTVAAMLLSCGGEDPAMARKKFEVILRDDLAAIVEDIPAKDLHEKPYFEIVSYRNYEGKYSVKAAADFYFFRTVRAKIVRKYRYDRSKGLWDRYFNEYRFLPDSTQVPDKP